MLDTDKCIYCENDYDECECDDCENEIPDCIWEAMVLCDPDLED